MHDMCNAVTKISYRLDLVCMSGSWKDNTLNDHVGLLVLIIAYTYVNMTTECETVIIAGIISQ